MKKRKSFNFVLLIVLILSLTILFVACSKDAENESKIEEKVPDMEPVYYSTSFNCNSACGSLSGNLSQTIKQGEYSEEVTAVANPGYVFDSWSNGCTDETITISPKSDTVLTAQFVKVDFELPVMEIFTEGSHLLINKESWTNCTINVSNTEEEYEFTGNGARIKGRGNSTWAMPKKPYKIKFDSKIDLFGNGKSKNWVLLANYDDPSALRNHLAFSTAGIFKNLSKVTTTSQFVNLFANDVYLGIYQVCEQIETGKNRVNIDEDTTKLDTGYIVEMDGRIINEGGILDVDCFGIGANYYAIKDPDPDDLLTPEHTLFIKNYMTEAYNAAAGNSYDTAANYINMDSFAENYIVHEIFKSVDLGWTSMYFYKDAGGKLCSGPPWDFDISAGNCDYEDSSIDYNNLYAKNTNVWFKNLLKFDEFKELVAKKLNDNKDDIYALYNGIKDEMLNNKIDIDENFKKWDTIGQYVWPNSQAIVDIKTWEGQVDYLVDWLKHSVENMVKTYVVSPE